ncbi:fibronectin type III-like domain-contianing protein [Massilia phyllosphaerae]|uniref:fibronectin type III-like domain-contianing protein n=1 Tax=Massilia phyllosphaerae TaxID=3106034 RepID=UPI002B1CD90E|nr:fibronectin type III-like domain-contianing protein [Massilia sp. SGZ-792]
MRSKTDQRRLHILHAGESKQVTIPIDARSLAYYTQAKGAWQLDAGKYRILVGAASDDLPLDETLTVPAAAQLSTTSSNPLPLRQAVQVGTRNPAVPSTAGFFMVALTPARHPRSVRAATRGCAAP